MECVGGRPSIKWSWDNNERQFYLIAANLYVSAFHTLATALNLKPNHTEGIMLLASKSECL